MARRNEAGQLLLAGLNPRQIAASMSISLNSVKQYLCTLVGEGEISAADIAFSIEEGPLIEEGIRNNSLHVPFGRFAQMKFAQAIRDALLQQGHNVSRDQAILIELYLMTRDPRPDLYALICEVEISLHRLIRKVLSETYSEAWWSQGVPLEIRKSCHSRREEDDRPSNDAFSYTTFIDLKAIIEKNWKAFASGLPKDLAANKQSTSSNLVRLNQIRNRVMHPVKTILDYKDDFLFARSFAGKMRDLPVAGEPDR